MSLILVLWCSWMAGLSVPSEDPSKNKNKYKFHQAWVWEYQNDWIPSGEAGHKGEIIVYHDTLTRAWLFDAEAYGATGQGFDFVLGTYDGLYTFCFKDEKGKSRKVMRTVPEVSASRNDDASVREEFESLNKETERKKVFGKNIYGWPAITGKEYSRENLRTTEKTLRYIADSNVDFQTVFCFNFLEGDVKLPVHFPSDIPLGKVLLEDSTVYDDGKKIVLRLKEISDTEYNIDLSKYKTVSQ